jgi:hypothetical protein
MIVGPAAGPSGGPGGDDEVEAPGVTRFDVVCRSHFVDTVLALTRRWAEDRALQDGAVTRLVRLMRAAVVHGRRFDPRGVTLLIRWQDPDRVRLDLRWRGCTRTARPSKAGDDVGATISTLDGSADEWGVVRRGHGWAHWMVFDTR